MTIILHAQENNLLIDENERLEFYGLCTNTCTIMYLYNVQMYMYIYTYTYIYPLGLGIHNFTFSLYT